MEREGDGSPSLPMLFCLETEDRKILGTGRATLLQKPGFLNYCRWRGCLPTRNTITSAGIQQPAKALMFGGMFIPASPSILTHCELEWLLSALLRWVPRHFSHKKKVSPALLDKLFTCFHIFSRNLWVRLGQKLCCSTVWIRPPSSKARGITKTFCLCISSHPS